MATDIKISQMPEATSLEGIELIPIVQNGTNKVTTPNKLKEGLATATQLNNKVDKEEGKGLSQQDFTTTLKNKLDGIEEQANKYEHPANHPATMITEDTTHRFVTDTEKNTWNSKANTEDIIGKTDPESEGTGIIFNDYNGNKASGIYSQAGGYQCIASGQASLSHGFLNTASGNFSIALGGGSTYIYLDGEAGTTKYECCKTGWLGSTLSKKELVEYFKQEGLRIKDTEKKIVLDHKIVDVVYEEEEDKLFLILDKTLSDSEILVNKNFEIIRNICSGVYSLIEGYANFNSSSSSHVEGNDNTLVKTQSSHVEGVLNYVSGISNDDCIHVEGLGNIAQNLREHAQGQYNKSNTGSTDDIKTIHSIGVGTKDIRKNAQEVMRNGDHYIIGVGEYDGTNPSESQTLQEVISSKVDKVSGKSLVSNSDINRFTILPKSSGIEGQILVSTGGYNAQWKYVAQAVPYMLDLLAYGVELDSTYEGLDPHLYRVGNSNLHKSLPIQNKLKGCIAQADNIMYWLNNDDWRWRETPIIKNITLNVEDNVYTITDELFSTKQYDKQWIKIQNVACQIASINTDNNTATLFSNNQLLELGLSSSNIDIELGAVLNGYDGTVRIYCPTFYIGGVSVPDNVRKKRIYISEYQIFPYWTKQPEVLIDAYRSTILNEVPEGMGYLSTLPQNSAVSIVNTETYCRGGKNNASLDQYLNTDQFRTSLGKPRTKLNRAEIRTYANNANSYPLSYVQYRNIFYWLWTIEYANRNSQEEFKEELTSEGFHQGGLGDGITTINSSDVSKYNDYQPIVPCGYGNDMGNNTGLKQINATIGDNEYTLFMPRWRGFDNIFGDINTVLDGIIIDNDTYGDYICTDGSKFSDIVTDDYTKLFGNIYYSQNKSIYYHNCNWPEILPSNSSPVSGSSTTGSCDTIERMTSYDQATLCMGGTMFNKEGSGLGRILIASIPEVVYTTSGFRTVSRSVNFDNLNTI